MAAGVFPAPGTDRGPCDAPCRHIDCAQTREMAATNCVRCDRPIGYDRHFYRDADGLSHVPCLLQATEATQ